MYFKYKDKQVKQKYKDDKILHYNINQKEAIVA